MVEWITGIMTSLGYWGVGFLMFLENLFPPIPSELIMPFAGFMVSQGKWNFGVAVFAGVLGTILGAFPWYYAGKFVGEQRLRQLADRYGKWLTISGKDIDQANAWFTKHGGKAVFLCRLVPGVRTIISLPAGINSMPLLPFVLYSTFGTTLWVTFLTAFGFFLGEHYDKVDEYLGPVSKFVVLGLMIVFGLFVFKRQRSQAKRRRGRS
jgi:membrane protein DedA with SNARE-associated domain